MSPSDDLQIQSGAAVLACHLSWDGRQEPPERGLLLCHGLPSDTRGVAGTGCTYPGLADQLASETGWAVCALQLRGTGPSTGDMSVGAWLEDIRAAVEHLRHRGGIPEMWLAGFGEGGILALEVAASDREIGGVASLGAPANLGRYAARDPRELVALARCQGLLRTPGFPADAAAWASEAELVRPYAAAAAIAPRPLLIVHGAGDQVVPVTDARSLAEAAGEGAELRILPGAEHGLREDPRAIAVLMGWLERRGSPGE